MAKVYPRYKVYIKKNAIDSSGKRILELTGATYTWTVASVTDAGIAELSRYSGTTSYIHVYDPPIYVHENYLVVVEEACQHYTIDDIEEVLPTCTHTGSTAGTKCRNCGEFLLNPITIPALGHDFVYDVIERTRICRTCGATKDEDQPVRIMQSDITRLMNVVEEFMLEDTATMLDTTIELRCAAKVFIQQYTYTTKDQTESSPRETTSPSGEFHIYFEDTQGAHHYLTLTPVGKDDVILSHGVYDIERLQSTVLGKEGLPSRFKLTNDGKVVGLFETGVDTTAMYYLINSTDGNLENNISITTSPGNQEVVKFYPYSSPKTAVTTVAQKTPYVMAAKIHGEGASTVQDKLCYVTGIIIR